MTGEQLEALQWLSGEGAGGVELWRFPEAADLPSLLSARLVSIGTLAGDERLRVWITSKGEKAIVGR